MKSGKKRDVQAVVVRIEALKKNNKFSDDLSMISKLNSYKRRIVSQLDLDEEDDLDEFDKIEAEIEKIEESLVPAVAPSAKKLDLSKAKGGNFLEEIRSLHHKKEIVARWEDKYKFDDVNYFYHAIQYFSHYFTEEDKNEFLMDNAEHYAFYEMSYQEIKEFYTSSAGYDEKEFFECFYTEGEDYFYDDPLLKNHQVLDSFYRRLSQRIEKMQAETQAKKSKPMSEEKKEESSISYEEMRLLLQARHDNPKGISDMLVYCATVGLTLWKLAKTVLLDLVHSHYIEPTVAREAMGFEEVSEVDGDFTPEPIKKAEDLPVLAYPIPLKFSEQASKRQGKAERDELAMPAIEIPDLAIDLKASNRIVSRA